MTFKHSKKWYFWASWIAWTFAVMFCFVPPLMATILNFPMMVTKNSNSTISIFFVIGILLAASVAITKVVKSFKDNALLSVAVVLAAVTALLICGYHMEKATIEGLAWVAGSGSAGVLVGLCFFKLHKLWNDLYKNCGEVYVK